MVLRLSQIGPRFRVPSCRESSTASCTALQLLSQRSLLASSLLVVAVRQVAVQQETSHSILHENYFDVKNQRLHYTYSYISTL